MDTTIFSFILCLVLILLIVILGILEKRKNDLNLKKLSVTVNVNGIRGKSTATRLITAILCEAGYRAVGKTTGTSARMIYFDTDEEQDVIRRPHGISISEQFGVIDKAVKYGADALVCECMAVRPEYQSIYQHRIINAKLVVITNVLEDHLDEMGPTTEQIAWAFAETIPYNGMVVVSNDDFTEFFKSVAKKRNTKVFVADDSLIDDDYLSKFDYHLFPHNCSIALAAAEALGIDRETALRAMLKAHPDPGALRFYNLNTDVGSFVVANAFAANEPTSSLDVWDVIKERYPKAAENPIILMNCRADRVDRTKQFITGFFPMIPNSTLIVIGENANSISKAYANGALPSVAEYLDLQRKPIDKIISTIKPFLADRVVICVGNIHGCGYPALAALLQLGGVECPKIILDEGNPNSPFRFKFFKR